MSKVLTQQGPGSVEVNVVPTATVLETSGGKSGCSLMSVEGWMPLIDFCRALSLHLVSCKNNASKAEAAGLTLCFSYSQSTKDFSSAFCTAPILI